jgi:outer membrane protein assembly factor BamB
MWTKPVNDGGIVGGAIGTDIGMNFYSGLAYNARFANPIIMYGRLYYELPNRNSASGGGYLCVDLRSGEEQWYLEGTPVPSFGAYYDYEDPNQHGVIPNGVLFTNNFGRAIDPLTGRYWYNMTNVPSGQETRTKKGEILRYVIDYTGHWLAEWNASRVETTSTSGSLNASTPNRYDWNVTIPSNIPADSHTLWASVDDLLLGTNLVEVGIGGFFTRPDPYTVWAISLKPETRGQLLWMKDYPAPTGNVSQVFQRVDPENRVVLFQYKETMLFSAISLDNGNIMWEQKTRIEGANDFDYYDNTVVSQRASVAYGRMYYTGMGGILYCYDTKTGALLWTYGNGGPGNSTAMGLNGVYPYFPSYIYSIADGKVYTLTGEHSPNVPLYTNGQTRCVDAYTGKELWTLTGWGGYPSRTGAATADGFFVYFNCYDSQIYCIGKGPSATTVDAPMTAVPAGTGVVIRGTVTDQSPGAKAKGTAAVSDESMKEWMEYMYMQKTKPKDTTGVNVKITAIDPNGNLIPIGEATSDSSGLFSYLWKTPNIPGKYTITATFEGTNSYWPSSAETAMAVDPAIETSPAVITPTPQSTASPTPIQTTPPAPTPTTVINPPTSESTTTVYVAIAATVVIVVIAAAAILMRKRKA